MSLWTHRLVPAKQLGFPPTFCSCRLAWVLEQMFKHFKWWCWLSCHAFPSSISLWIIMTNSLMSPYYQRSTTGTSSTTQTSHTSQAHFPQATLLPASVTPALPPGSITPSDAQFFRNQHSYCLHAYKILSSTTELLTRASNLCTWFHRTLFVRMFQCSHSPAGWTTIFTVGDFLCLCIQMAPSPAAHTTPELKDNNSTTASLSVTQHCYQRAMDESHPQKPSFPQAAPLPASARSAPAIQAAPTQAHFPQTTLPTASFLPALLPATSPQPKQRTPSPAHSQQSTLFPAIIPWGQPPSAVPPNLPQASRRIQTISHHITRPWMPEHAAPAATTILPTFHFTRYPPTVQHVWPKPKPPTPTPTPHYTTITQVAPSSAQAHQTTPLPASVLPAFPHKQRYITRGA